jgi:hypothetical protein
VCQLIRRLTLLAVFDFHAICIREFPNTYGRGERLDGGDLYSSGPQMSLDRLSQLLATRVQDHECCRYIPFLTQSGNTKTIVLIDVIESCLVEASADTARVAPSYVLGKAQTLMTTAMNFSIFKKKYALLQFSDKIPNTI